MPSASATEQVFTYMDLEYVMSVRCVLRARRTAMLPLVTHV
jgi:hypothetical protein